MPEVVLEALGVELFQGRERVSQTTSGTGRLTVETKQKTRPLQCVFTDYRTSTKSCQFRPLSAGFDTRLARDVHTVAGMILTRVRRLV